MIRHAAAASLAAAFFAAALPARAATIFISNEKDNTVTVLDSETMAVVKSIPTGARPRGKTHHASDGRGENFRPKQQPIPAGRSTSQGPQHQPRITRKKRMNPGAPRLYPLDLRRPRHPRDPRDPRLNGFAGRR